MPALNPGRNLRRLLKADVQAAAEGRLGMTQAERDQASGAAQEAAARQAAAQIQDVQRATMASGANQFTGASAQLQRDIARESANAAAGARVAQDQLSAQIAQARRQALQAALERQQELARADRKMALGLGMQAAGGAASVVPGGQVYAQMLQQAGTSLMGGE